MSLHHTDMVVYADTPLLSKAFMVFCWEEVPNVFIQTQ